MKKLTTFFLMFLVALGISFTLSFIIEILGFAPYLTQRGLNYQSLITFCMIFGFAGSFISLLISKRMVKWTMKIQVIDPIGAQGDARWLYETVKRLADNAGLPRTPEVGIYNSPELNAFATGPSKSDSLVAVSSGLLSSMNRDEVEGVLGHEVAHVANGDMVRMALLQGIINTLILFFAKALAYLIVSSRSSGNDRDRGGYGGGTFMLSYLLQIVFGVVGSIIVSWYSRKREFRADSGGASLAGRHKMIAALEALRDRSRVLDNNHPQLETLKISGHGSFMRMFMSHPPIEERIQALKAGI